MAIARRVVDLDQRLHPALIDLVSVARLPLDARRIQMLDRSEKGRFAGQFPAGRQVTRLAAFDNQHAKGPLIHLHVQTTARRRQHLHAQHVLGVTLPMAEIFDLRDEIAQTANVDHAWVLVD